MTNTLGVIAGGGQFPRLFIEAARDTGKKPVVVGVTEEEGGTLRF